MPRSQDADYLNELTHERHVQDCVLSHVEELRRHLDDALRTVTKDMVRPLTKINERRRADLDQAAAKPFFGRLDVAETAVLETFYIGHALIECPDGGPTVINWQAPFAERFYQATTSDHLDVVRRRTFRHEKRKGRTASPGNAPRIESLSDELFRTDITVPPAPLMIVDGRPQVEEGPTEIGELSETAPVAADQPTPDEFELTEPQPDEIDLREAPIDLTVASPPEDEPPSALDTPSDAELDEINAQLSDLAEQDRSATDVEELPDDDAFEIRAQDLLLEELEQERSEKLGDIVATIQADQDRLIRSDPHTPLVIQGGPGTGKTVVVLHRLSWVLYTLTQKASVTSPPNALVVGPSNRFIDYIGDVLPSLGDRDAVHLSIDDLARSPLSSSEQARLSQVRSDPPEVSRLKGDPRMASVIERAIWANTQPTAIEFGVGTMMLRQSREDLDALIDEFHRRGMSYNEARGALVSELGERLANERSRRSGIQLSTKEVGALIDDFGRHAREIDLVEQVMPRLSPLRVIERLYTDHEFRDIAASSLTSEERSLLERPRGRSRWTRDDLPLLDTAAAMISGPPERYAHVVVDEAQDLSPMQWNMIMRRVTGGSITITGDLAQATGAWSPGSWREVAAWAGFGDNFDLGELRLGYRVPVETMSFAARLLPRAAPAVDPPRSFREVRQPKIRRLIGTGKRGVDDKRLARLTAQLVDDLGDGGRTAVIVPPDLETRVRTALGADRPDVVVVVDRDAKGLEFDRVIVVEPAAIVGDDGPLGLRRLFVAFTRTTKELYVIAARPLPADLFVSDRSTDRYVRNGRRWEPAEDELLRRESAAGWTVAQMAIHHRRSPKAITSRLRQLGLEPIVASTSAP